MSRRNDSHKRDMAAALRTAERAAAAENRTAKRAAAAARSAERAAARTAERAAVAAARTAERSAVAAARSAKRTAARSAERMTANQFHTSGLSRGVDAQTHMAKVLTTPLTSLSQHTSISFNPMRMNHRSEDITFYLERSASNTRMGKSKRANEYAKAAKDAANIKPLINLEDYIKKQPGLDPDLFPEFSRDIFMLTLDGGGRRSTRRRSTHRRSTRRRSIRRNPSNKKRPRKRTISKRQKKPRTRKRS